MTAAPERKSIFGTKLRWGVCGLLFFATTVNYVDRQVLGILKPVIQGELHWTEQDYGWILFMFQLAYALMMPFAGRAMDWLGTRLGYAIAVVVWSVASMLHSLASTPLQFGLCRFGLGIGESANFPAAIKTVADWFPRRERALATGLFNSGSNIGAIIAPLCVPLVAHAFGWRSSFLFTGALDLVWLLLWLSVYQPPEKHQWLTRQEMTLIRSDGESETAVQVPYLQLLQKRPAWAYLLGKVMTDPVWWFYIFWVPGFLHDRYGLDLTHIGPPLVVIFLAADIGSIGGGWMPSWLVSRGWDISNARKGAMLVCALAVVPVALIAVVGANLWLTVGLISLAAAAHQGWSANLYTIVSDTFPRPTVGSAIGLGGMGGAFSGMLVAPAIGMWLDYSNKSYGPLFLVSGLMYVMALVVIHALVPKIRPV